MADLLIRNIAQLAQVREVATRAISGERMSFLPILEDAWLLAVDGRIQQYGPMTTCPDRADVEIDATGRIVLPAWCDPHTHLVHAATREREFVDRIKGLTYEQIAARGGGILNSAARLRQMDEDILFEDACQRLNRCIASGTGAIEIKSGYGLTPDAELKMLRVIRRLREWAPVPVKATFLGAHAFPIEFKEDREGYVKLIIDRMIPDVASEGLADFIDVFCEVNYFTPEQTDRILDAGVKYGLRPKVHVNQFNAIGGIAVAQRHGALSVDHLEVMDEADIRALKGSGIMPTVLPGCSHFLGIPFAPVRQMLDAGLPVALATDHNPGSAPSGNMGTVVSLACIKMRMLPEEAINAATVNAAVAMAVADRCGSITVGKRADLIITDRMESVAAIPYHFGHSTVWKMIVAGREFKA